MVCPAHQPPPAPKRYTGMDEIQRDEQPSDPSPETREPTDQPAAIPQTNEQLPAGAPEPATEPAPAPTPDPSASAVPSQPLASPSSSDDLDAEIAAALGDLSIDDLIEESESPNISISNDGRRTRTGTVARIDDNMVLIEFGPKSPGICPVTQFDEPPAVGSKHEFVVERFDPFDGVLVVSLPGAIQKADWGTLEVGQIIEARCIGMNRGGLEMEVDHHKGFMPAGQVDIRHLPDISVLIGEKFPCKVIELKKHKKRLILSRKAVLLVERASNRETLLAEIEPGQVRTATITSLQNYGAFADLGGIDGLIHVSDISHERIKHPEDVLKVGDTVEVKILKVESDVDPPRIALGRKQVLSNPADTAYDSIEADAELSGTVTKTTDFGAFVELAPGIEGLIHISQLTHEHVPNVEHVVKKGEVVRVKVLSVDQERRRISLSMKALTEAPAREPRPGRGRGRDEPNVNRAEDPAMRKLRARFSGDLKGGLG